MSEQELHDFAINAVNRHAEKSVMPMVAEIGNEAQVWGTAILVAHKDNCFIITADHVAKYLHTVPIGVPAGPLKSELWQIGNATRHACQYDLAIVHLHDQDLIGRICSAWVPLNYGDVRQPYLSQNAFYVIYGFPSSTSDLRDEVLHSTPISLVTGEFEGERKGFKIEHPFNTNVDLLLAYSDTAIDPRTGNDICGIPLTEGMSGSPVWQISREGLHNNNDLWSPESNVRVVGFYTSANVRYGWLRVRHWVVVDNLLKNLNLL